MPSTGWCAPDLHPLCGLSVTSGSSIGCPAHPAGPRTHGPHPPVTATAASCADPAWLLSLWRASNLCPALRCTPTAHPLCPACCISPQHGGCSLPAVCPVPRPASEPQSFAMRLCQGLEWEIRTFQSPACSWKECPGKGLWCRGKPRGGETSGRPGGWDGHRGRR